MVGLWSPIGRATTFIVATMLFVSDKEQRRPTQQQQQHKEATKPHYASHACS